MWDVISRLNSKNDATVILTSHSMEECEALCTRVGIMVEGQLKCIGPIQHLKSRFGKGLIVQVKMLSPSQDALRTFLSILRKNTSNHNLEASERLDREGVKRACEKLNHGFLTPRVSKDDISGWMISSALEKDGWVLDSTLCEWCISEDAYSDLETFFKETFSLVECMERRGEHSKWRVEGSSLSLGQIFEQLELRKTDLGISEYAVTQATLEQIFVFFASQQAIREE